MAMDRTYICIDLKSYYASVEAVSRGYDPLKCNLLVADNSRTDKTIVLAVSPALKAIGVPGRPRLFEAKQKIKEYEIEYSAAKRPLFRMSGTARPRRGYHLSAL